MGLFTLKEKFYPINICHFFIKHVRLRTLFYVPMYYGHLHVGLKTIPRWKMQSLLYIHRFRRATSAPIPDDTQLSTCKVSFGKWLPSVLVSCLPWGTCPGSVERRGKLSLSLSLGPAGPGGSHDATSTCGIGINVILPSSF